MHRHDYIEWLVKNDINTIKAMCEDEDTSYLAHILNYGFIGYNNLPITELINLYIDRSE